MAETATFTWALHPAGKNLVKVLSTVTDPAGAPSDALRRDMAAFYAWLQQKFHGAPFRLMAVMGTTDLVLDAPQEALLAESSLGIARAFPVERGAYVVGSATMRLQYGRVFREHQLAGRFRAFEHERDGLAFLQE